MIDIFYFFAGAKIYGIQALSRNHGWRGTTLHNAKLFNVQSK
jgi:hypothetical protein